MVVTCPYSTLWVYRIALPGICVCQFVRTELGTAIFQQWAIQPVVWHHLALFDFESNDV